MKWSPLIRSIVQAGEPVGAIRRPLARPIRPRRMMRSPAFSPDSAHVCAEVRLGQYEYTLAQDADETEAADDAGIAFPVMLGGQLLSPTTYSGEEWLEQFFAKDCRICPVTIEIVVADKSADKPAEGPSP